MKSGAVQRLVPTNRRPPDSHWSILIDNRRLIRNTIFNLLSLAGPMLLALIAFPLLIARFGTDRFGILALCWTLIGYCSLFDFGLGRAVTQLVARQLGASSSKDLPQLVWTALLLMLAMGAAGALLVGSFSSLLASSILKIPVELQSESVKALRLAALAVPAVTVAAGLRGILEAHQQFGKLSLIRTANGILTFGGPLLSPDLATAVATLAAARVGVACTYAAICLRTAPQLLGDRRWRPGRISPLVRFGGWLTVSNLISPIMASLDRFLLGSLVSVTSVAYYATPQEITSALRTIAGAVTETLFPALTSSAFSNPALAWTLLRKGLLGSVSVLLPISAGIVLVAQPALAWWIDAEFAKRSYRVLQILSAGVLVNAAGSLPAAMLHAAGRPDLTAKLHLIELPLYLSAAVVLIRAWGIEGAAVAWTLRVALDSILLFVLAANVVPVTRHPRSRSGAVDVF